MTDHAIHMQHLTRSFGNVRAVDDLSLTVATGEVFGFLGHNGAGKTTTVRLLNGVLESDSGQMTVLGLNPQTDGATLRARTGVLTEMPSLDERLTGTENLIYYADLYSIPADRVQQRVNDVLETFGLSDRGSDRVGGYSKGMKQRLALARAFLHSPELIFLDEPTSGLDPIATQEVHDMIRHVSRDEGRTVFLCTHNLIEAQSLCDRVAILEHGRIKVAGAPHELAQQVGTRIRYVLEIAPQQMDAACVALAQMTAVEAVEASASSLTITVTDREVIPDALASLVTAQIRVYAVTQQQVSLEDIYLALHGRKEADS
ncbi:ABC transporter ATP-binding protein [Phototrophicus methaneseepsis]|nr:ABC transporter ATP-binding protein [Phototrophicus methaneseepsis]